MSANRWKVEDVYIELIKKLEELDEGEVTEFNTEVSQEMIEIIKKRYLQLFLTKANKIGSNGMIGIL